MTLRHLLFILPLCVFVPARGTLAATILEDVTVRVYDAAGLDAAARAAALHVAAATLAPSGAHVWWRDCTVRGSVPACERAPRPGELVLRIVNSTSATGSASSRMGQ